MLLHKPGETIIWLYDPANGTKTRLTPATLEGAKALAPVTGLNVDGPHNGTWEASAEFIDGLVEITPTAPVVGEGPTRAQRDAIDAARVALGTAISDLNAAAQALGTI
jgi:hypothetical protein